MQNVKVNFQIRIGAESIKKGEIVTTFKMETIEGVIIDSVITDAPDVHGNKRVHPTTAYLVESEINKESKLIIVYPDEILSIVRGKAAKVNIKKDEGTGASE